MSTTVLSHMRVHPAEADDDHRKLRAIVEQTRDFPGCERMELLVSQEDTTRVVLLVEWTSEADYDSYRSWRADHGAADLLALLAEPSRLEHYTPV